MSNELSKGVVRVGYLLDGVDDGVDPQSAAIFVSERDRIRVRVPMISPEMLQDLPGAKALSEKTSAWFQDRGAALPASVEYVDIDGTILLMGLSVALRRGLGVGEGTLEVDAAILGKPTAILEEYRVRELDSSIDGLHDFSGFRVWRWDEELAREHRDLVGLRRHPVDPVEWESAGFRFVLRPRDESIGTEGVRFRLDETTRLVTTHAGGATVREHYQAQRSMRALLVLAYAVPLRWREHWLLDDLFPVRFLSGDTGLPERTKVLISSTLPEHAMEEPSRSQLAFPAVRLAALTDENLTQWTLSYLGDEAFRRAVEPAVEAISMAGVFMETRVMMLASSLEWFGYCGLARKRLSLPKAIEWTLDCTGVDWPDVGTRKGLGAFAARVNNDLKHPDRGNRPTHSELYAAMRLMIMAAQGQLLHKVGAGEVVWDNFRQSPNVDRVHQVFVLNDLRVDVAGS